jgi:hypothetical protein
MTLAKLTSLKEEISRIAVVEREWNIQQKRLLDLPSRMGFQSVAELIAALELASSVNTDTVKRKKRAVITHDVRAAVRAKVRAGLQGREIARELKLSPATVQNIKAELGLTKRRGTASR